MSAAGWLPVAEAAMSVGLEVEAHWTKPTKAYLRQRPM